MTKTTTAIVREFKPPQRETKTTTAQKTSRRRSEGKKKSFPKDPKRRNKLSRSIGWYLLFICWSVSMRERRTRTTNQAEAEHEWSPQPSKTRLNQLFVMVLGPDLSELGGLWSFQFSVFVFCCCCCYVCGLFCALFVKNDAVAAAVVNVLLQIYSEWEIKYALR